MIRTRIRYQGKKVTLRGVGFGRYQMLALGNAGLRSVKKRISKGIGAYDTPMKPLSDKRNRRVIIDKTGNKRVIEGNWRGYKTQKVRRGGQPFRDLRSANPGKHMMDNLSVRWASNNQVSTAFTSRKARMKALANTKIDWFLAYSSEDQKVVVRRARQLFRAEVGAVRASLVRGRPYRRGVRRAA